MNAKSDTNTVFTRKALSLTHEDVRQCFPGVAPMNAASVTGESKSGWFVQIIVEGFAPFDDFYRAFDAYEARDKAWGAFIKKYAPVQIKRELGYDVDEGAVA